ncbi:MAG TPA: cation:proton antiporter, partial [Solibacterales bacterium]|nr:cation:proton antiporter [Bryobacterales bacterium]
VVFPFLLGWGILRLWGEPQIEAIFLGAAMVATSVGITAQVLSAKGVLHARAARIILAAAVIDDVLGLLVLAVVSSMAKGSINFVEIGITAALSIGFTLLVAVLGRRAMNRLVPRVSESFRAGEAQFNLALILLFGLSVLAIYAGVAAIIGAFLAGMALAESVSHRVHDLAHGVTEFLIPFFLAGIGLHLNVAVFADRSTLLLSAVILLAAVASKLVGCGLGGLQGGFADAFRIGAGMVPRGEVGMVVAQIGLGLGVISGKIYAVTVFMAVVTTLVAPPLLNLSFRGTQAVEPKTDFTYG